MVLLANANLEQEMFWSIMERWVTTTDGKEV